MLLLDADFVVSAGLHEKLSGEMQFKALTEDTAFQRNAIVLPAFETEASLGIDQGGEIATQAQASAWVASACSLLLDPWCVTHCLFLACREPWACTQGYCVSGGASPTVALPGGFSLDANSKFPSSCLPVPHREPRQHTSRQPSGNAGTFCDPSCTIELVCSPGACAPQATRSS